MPGVKWPFAALAILVLIGGGVLALRHQRAEVLRTEVMLAREDQGELATLRAENRRLAALQISEAEFERLQADRAAVPRLRTEVDALRARTEQMEQSGAATVAPPPPEISKPAMTLKLGVNADGGLSFEDRALNLNQLRQRLAALPRGYQVMVGLRLPETRQPMRTDLTDTLKQNVQEIMNLAREFDLKMVVRFEEPPFIIQSQQPKS